MRQQSGSGLMAPGSSEEASVCLAVPGKILSTSGDEPLSKMARVSFGGVVKEVSLAYVPDAKVGDYVIVHVGFALNVLDEAEARQVLAYLEEIGDNLGEELERDGGERPN